MKKTDGLEKKDDSKNRSKRSIVFNNNELKKSSDSKGMLYYGRNNGNYMNKMNSERHDILPTENKEEEKKEV